MTAIECIEKVYKSKYGNGATRKERLKKVEYDADTVQKIVNKMK